jgi:benzoyl-CoA reductase/2-hydroxyglutaryl-CoA dehydratase subunit BcrC/BadD/HgdB
MADNRELWTELGIDLKQHDVLLGGLGPAFADIYLSQRDRPKGMGFFDFVVGDIHGIRVHELREHARKGSKVVATYCVFVPEEFVWAAGGIPVGLCAGAHFSVPLAEEVLPRNTCALIKSSFGFKLGRLCPYVQSSHLIVGETTCDAKKKTWDLLAKDGGLHVIELPQKKGPRDRDLWLEEVFQFRARLERVTGRALDPERLAAAVRLMNRKRRALGRLNDFRKAERPPISGLDALVVMQGALVDDTLRFTERLDALNDELEDRTRRGTGVAPDEARRIMISGCPSVMGNWKLHALVESAGALIVCDETCTGSRYYENLVEEIGNDPDAQIAAIAARYLGITCSCFSPNDERIEAILRLAREHRVDGVIQYVLQYCHTYNVEAVAVAAALKGAGIPSLKIVTDYAESDTGQLRLRVDAFLEGLGR